MITVGIEQGLITLDLGGRRRDTLLSCASALRLAEALDLAVLEAEPHQPRLIRGEVWSCKVESFDGLVALRFSNPDIGAPARVPLPPAAARQLAEAIRTKAEQAKHKFRLVLQPRRG